MDTFTTERHDIIDLKDFLCPYGDTCDNECQCGEELEGEEGGERPQVPGNVGPFRNVP